MARALVVLGILGLLANTASAKGGAAVRTVLDFARLQARSFGTSTIYRIRPCGEYCRSSAPHLFTTRDARYWREVTPPHMLGEVEDAVFLTRSLGWVVANDCSAGRAAVYRTRTGGRIWRRTSVPATNCAAGSRLDLSFSDKKYGWILDVLENGNRVGLMRTRNGGRTWTQVGEPPLKGSIVFATPRRGWLARSDFAVSGQLYATTTGGRSWRREPLRLPGSWRHARAFPDRPTFFGARGVLPVDLAWSGHNAVAFYTTADVGQTWQLRAVRRVDYVILSSAGSGFVRYVPTSIASPSAWWIAEGRTRPGVAVTSDAGASWHIARAPFVGSEISASDSRQAWLTNTRGKGALYATGDGGRGWRRLTLP